MRTAQQFHTIKQENAGLAVRIAMRKFRIQLWHRAGALARCGFVSASIADITRPKS